MSELTRPIRRLLGRGNRAGEAAPALAADRVAATTPAATAAPDDPAI